MYSLEEIFSQATKDKQGIYQKLKNKIIVINYGYKIQKFKERIEILNCSKGGDYFVECNDEEYLNFYIKGWKTGSILNNLENCKRKLEMIEEKVKMEINTRKNDKYIQHLKNRRELILNKYTNLKNKLNGKKEQHI
ncbi:MAG: hypothetical protein GOVbin1629_15 [Prokaryotic dsDNA virus sp.]|nr:MAG: hypothetical protein GOVbin1629_15 [Prokaryotic dsDNA virus sp.]|tara:strand:+ start:1408 stop:1815 length:408 start_codon:yes stop_codon:yes gene_type:complete